jgi:hypothetical protein
MKLALLIQRGEKLSKVFVAFHSLAPLGRSSRVNRLVDLIATILSPPTHVAAFIAAICFCHRGSTDCGSCKVNVTPPLTAA